MLLVCSIYVLYASLSSLNVDMYTTDNNTFVGIVYIFDNMARVLDSSWNVMVHVGAQKGKWTGNWRMEWVASTLHTSSEHGVSSITSVDAHTSAASGRLNWRPHQFKWSRPFRRKTKSGFCACAITFQLACTICIVHMPLLGLSVLLCVAKCRESTCTCHKGIWVGGGIKPLIHNLSSSWGWVVRATAALHMGEEQLITIWGWAGMAPEMIWMPWRLEKSLARNGNQTMFPSLPSYRLHYPTFYFVLYFI